MMWGYYPNGNGWLMMVVSNILWIVLLGILVWATVYWLKYRTNGPAPWKSDTSDRDFSALEILRQRYARGEIDTPTFEEMSKNLQIQATAEVKPEKEQSRA